MPEPQTAELRYTGLAELKQEGECARFDPYDRIKAGDRIKFAAERQRYTVRAAGKRYLVCTKPFNLRHTVLYTIVDLVKGIRGTENLIFGLGFETQEDCDAALARLEAGETEVSHRNFVPLDIESGAYMRLLMREAREESA
jgi:hypothetical protein